MYPGENLLGNEILQSSNRCFRIVLANDTTLSVRYNPATSFGLGFSMWESIATIGLPVNANRSVFQVRASMNKVSNIREKTNLT